MPATAAMSKLSYEMTRMHDYWSFVLIGVSVGVTVCWVALLVRFLLQVI
jgi:hypothetical protein